jgi:hypothetical protein
MRSEVVETSEEAVLVRRCTCIGLASEQLREQVRKSHNRIKLPLGWELHGMTFQWGNRFEELWAIGSWN